MLHPPKTLRGFFIVVATAVLLSGAVSVFVSMRRAGPKPLSSDPGKRAAQIVERLRLGYLQAITGNEESSSTWVTVEFRATGNDDYEMIAYYNRGSEDALNAFRLFGVSNKELHAVLAERGNRWAQNNREALRNNKMCKVGLINRETDATSWFDYCL